MDSVRAAELLVACRVLFGAEPDPRFLGILEESGLRLAWRRAALRTHPDRIPDPVQRRLQAERFIEARAAYALLHDFLGSRPASRRPATPRPTHQPGPRTERRQADRRWQAARPAHEPLHRLPGRRLRLGEFLYHARLISFEQLVEALVWQRRQRERFCEVGLRWGCLSPSQAGRLLAARRPDERVGAAAQRLRLLSRLQVGAVLAFQRSRQRPLGAFFVERRVLSPARLAALLRHLDAHNAGLGRR